MITLSVQFQKRTVESVFIIGFHEQPYGNDFQTLGINAQKYITTDAEVSGLWIMGISASELFGKPCFFVETSLTFQEFN